MSGSPFLTNVSNAQGAKKHSFNSFALLDPTYDASSDEEEGGSESEQGEGNNNSRRNSENSHTDKPITDSWEMPDFTDRYQGEMEEDKDAAEHVKSLSSSMSNSDRIKQGNNDSNEEEEDEEEVDDEELDIFGDELPYRKNRRLTSSLPKIPDLRFEQTYRKSIESANGVWWKIALITIRDQVLMTLAQGFLWQLTLVGVKSWRLAVAAKGSSAGQTYLGRISNWWAKVNNNQV